jgi:hypothetical protein
MSSRIKNALVGFATIVVETILGIIIYSLIGEVAKLIANPSIGGIAGILAIVGIVTIPLVVYLVLNRNKEAFTISPNFMHLEIHYSQKDPSPDVKNPDRQRYVANIKTRQAYWVPNSLDPYIKQHKINSYPYYDEKSLRANFKKSGIMVNDRPPLLNELGLRNRFDGSLVKTYEKMNPELLNKIIERKREGKLKNYRLIFLCSWYRSIVSAPNFPSKALLLDLENKKTYEAPLHSLELLENELLDFTTQVKFPWETLKNWSKRKGYDFVSRRYFEEELAGEF